MAILDGVKNAVASNVAAAANRSIRSGLTKVAGNLLGITTSFDGPQLGAMAPRAEKTRFSTKNLAYPMDVENDPRQGHYIFFNINVQDKAKIARQAFESRMRHHERKILAEFEAAKAAEAEFNAYDEIGGGGIQSVTSYEQIKKDYINKHIIEGYAQFGTDYEKGTTSSAGKKDSSSLQLQNPTTSRIKTAIALYMPPSVQVSYQADYSESEIGVLADMGAGLIAAYKAGADTKETALATLGKAETGIKKAALAALDVAAPGAKALAQIQTGKAITPKMEIMFNGIGHREFSYEFNFIPKNEQEASIVKEIIYEFKYHMASNFVEGSGNREMEIPSTFDITYQFMGGENENLNKISTCVLQKVDVEYGGDRFQAYAGGVPQQTKLSLAFKEMEVITKNRIVDGY